MNRKFLLLALASVLFAGCGKKSEEASSPVVPTPLPTQAAPEPVAASTPVPEPAKPVEPPPAPKAALPSAEDFCYQVRYSDDPGAVEKCLNDGMNPNVTNRDGFTPLVAALMLRGEMSSKMANLLLDHGAEVNFKLNDGSTAMFTAATHDDLSLVCKMIEAGGDLNISVANGTTPLMIAAKDGTPDVVKLFVEKGADVNAKDSRGKNAWAIAFNMAYSMADQRHKEIESILRQKTDRNDMEAILRGDKSLEGYLNVDKWLKDNLPPKSP